jgi:hypothetical protein
MNIQLAFAFGILAMVAIIMMVAIVIGIVKVIRHDKEFRNFHNEVNDCHRHISQVEKHIYEEINHVRINNDRYTEELKKEQQAYTDSRIDKALGTTKKQILKD